MAKERPQAPVATVKVNYVDPMLETELEFDRKFPDYKHVWKAEDSVLGDAEWAKDSKGEAVTNKMQRLARIPINLWNAKRKTQANTTLDLVKSVRTNEDGSSFVSDSLVKYANPKVVTGE